MAQTQTPVLFESEGDSIDYTAVADVYSGDVVTNGAIIGIVVRDIDYSENPLGAIRVEGTMRFPQTAAIITKGDPVFWDATGTPVTGTASTGAANGTGGRYLGICLKTTAATDTYVSVKRILSPGDASSVATVIVGGTAQANANAVDYGFTFVTGANDTAAVKLPAAAAGRVVTIKNAVSNKILKVFPGASDTINNAAANAVYNQTNGAFRTYVAVNAVDWQTDPETIA
jgi:predicted RecA/RadA family phage recombinase